MKVLTLIPARGGSKRLPRKNVLPLGGKPLIAWTIDKALKAGCSKDIIVSTDDVEIAEISEHYGAKVPWLRPKELSGDKTSTYDVVHHAVNWYEENYENLDAVLILQPTSPFRSIDSIKEAIRLFVETGGVSPVVSVSPSPCNPAWCFSIDELGAMKPFKAWDDVFKRSQDYAESWVLNGSIYITPCSYLRQNRRLFGPGALAVKIKSNIEGIDIDTRNDFDYAESLCVEVNAGDWL